MPREVGVPTHCAALVSKDKNIEGCRSKVCSFKDMDEARLFRKLAKCDINETDVKNNRT